MRLRRPCSVGLSSRILLVAAVVVVFGSMVGCSILPFAEGRDSKALAQAQRDYEAGSFLESERELGDLLKRTSDNLEALRMLGSVLAAQGKNEQAVAAYRRIVAKQPADHVSWYRIALLERLMGRSKQSEAHLRQALLAKPGDSTYIDELARAKMTLGQSREAAALWGRLLKNGNLSNDSRRNLLVLQGQAYQAAREYARAEVAFSEASALDPGDGGLTARVEVAE